MKEELTGRESRFSRVPIASRVALLLLNLPVVGAAPRAEKNGDSRKGIARGNDLMAGANVTIRVTYHRKGMGIPRPKLPSCEPCDQ